MRESIIFCGNSTFSLKFVMITLVDAECVTESHVFFYLSLKPYLLSMLIGQLSDLPHPYYLQQLPPIIALADNKFFTPI